MMNTLSPSSSTSLRSGPRQLADGVRTPRGDSLVLPTSPTGEQPLEVVALMEQSASSEDDPRNPFGLPLSADEGLTTYGAAQIAAVSSAQAPPLLRDDGSPRNVQALVQWVLKDAYLQTLCDLAYYAEKVKFYNGVKKALRAELSRANEAMGNLAGLEDDAPIDPPFEKTQINTEFTGGEFVPPPMPVSESAEMTAEPPSFIESLFKAFTDAVPELLTLLLNQTPLKHAPGLVGGIVNAFSGRGAAAPEATETEVNTKGQLEAYIKQREDELSSVGDDAQLSNVDLQNVLQKQQQTIQMMSNISKMVYDASLAIIRRIGP